MHSHRNAVPTDPHAISERVALLGESWKVVARKVLDIVKDRYNFRVKDRDNLRQFISASYSTAQRDAHVLRRARPVEIQDDGVESSSFESGAEHVSSIDDLTDQLCALAFAQALPLRPEKLRQYVERARDVFGGDGPRFGLLRLSMLLNAATREVNKLLRANDRDASGHDAHHIRTAEVGEKAFSQTRNVRQIRLRAVLDDSPPYLILDGRRYEELDEVAVYYLDALIRANGHRVPFTDWLKKHPKFEAAIVTRVLDKLPSEIQRFIERSKGVPARLKVEELESAQ